MNKNFIKRLLLVTLCSIVSIQLFATSVQDDDPKMPTDYMPIMVTRKPSNSDIHRGLIQDVEVYYYNKEIYFTFNKNIGEVTINVLNLSTGQSVCDYVDSMQGSFIIDISSMGVGQYEICIFNDSTTYEGSLIL